MEVRRIAIDARLLGASGIGTYIRNLLREFRRIEHRLWFTLIGDGEGLQGLVGSATRFEIVDTAVPVFSLLEQIRLPSLAQGCDLLHSPHHNVPVLWRGRLVVTFHDALHWDHPELVPGWRGRVYLKLVSRRIRRADAVIVPSRFTAQRVVERVGVPGDRVFVVPQGVDTHVFSRRSQDSVRAVLQKYGLKPGGYLLYVGNMKPHKNVERLVEAYVCARGLGVRAPLVLAGRVKGLRQAVDVDALAQNDGVRYIGEVPLEDLPYIYSGARAFLFVSLYEGFGLPPLEAMACGCPVLASSAASLPEVVGDAALLVNPADVDDIAKGIHKIALDLTLRRKLITKGFERVRRFSWQRTAKLTLQVYDKVFERRG